MPITITQKEYDRLRLAWLHLELLQARGVDNWIGYVSLPMREDYDTDEEWLQAIEEAESDC